MKFVAKRLILLTAMAALCLSACSGDNAPVVAPRPVVSTVLDTQAKIDAFGAQGRTAYAGRLVIGVENQPNSSIVNLIPLGDLTIVGGLTIFYNEQLGDLTGLNNLVAIGGEGLLITDNPKLTGTAPLAGVTAFGENIIIRRNNLLADLLGLVNLTTVAGDLCIESNARLLDIAGLGSLSSVSGDFTIRGNFRLETLTGLDDLSTIGGDFSIEDNHSLYKILELGLLRTVGGDFFIRNNYSLSLLGWTSLDAIRGHLLIEQNGSLEGINCSPLRSVGGDFSIQANEVSAVFNAPRTIGGNVAFADNPRFDRVTGLRDIGGTLLIQRNERLPDLDGLESLVSVGGALFVLNNPILEHFCGLGPFMRAGFSGSFVSVGNVVNPTVEEIKALAPCP